MNWFKEESRFTNANSEIRRNRAELVQLIEDEIEQFVQQEMIIYKRDPEHKDFSNSVIANLALFNISKLNTENGVEQIKNLFTDKLDQSVIYRLKEKLASLYIKYGSEEVDDIGNDVLTIMSELFNLDKRIIGNLDATYNTFWLQPMIAKAWNHLFNSASSLPEEKEK